MAAPDDHGYDLRVAVLGIGIMGSAMARRLVAAGLPTTVWDRSPSATAPLGQAGAVVAASAAEAVGDAGVVITMLPTADVVTSVSSRQARRGHRGRAAGRADRRRQAAQDGTG